MIKKATRTETVDFVQYDGQNFQELKEFCGCNLLLQENDWKRGHTLYVYCRDDHTRDVDPGDYVIRHPDGGLEVLTEKEFKEVYKEA